MVQSLNSSGKKPDGENRVTASSVGVVGANKSNSNSGQQVSDRDQVITTTSTGFVNNVNNRTVSGAAFNEQQLARSGSGGSDCLFSRSTEELLDLDLNLELRSDLQRQAASYHNNNIHNANLASNFSINNDDDHHHHHHFDHRTKGYSQYNDRTNNNYNNNTYSSSQYNKSCCFFFSNASWKHLTRGCRFNLPLYVERAARMTLKRYYMIIFCLVLVIASCLLASFVISRRVGDLDGDGDSSGSGPTLRLSALKAAIMGDDLESRSIDLIDLIESGKTFAFTKYRIQVKVPRGSPNYNQHPSFLLENIDNKNEAQLEAASSEIITEADSGANQEKYFLTSVKESTIHPDELEKTLDSKSILGSAPSTTTTPSSQLLDFGRSLLNLEIKPVANKANSKGDDAATPGIEDIAALLAMTTTGERRTEALGAIGDTSNRPINKANYFDQMDPLDQAASELQLNIQSINRTLIDCFLIDTEKRYEQRISLEDTYRQVASTRQVSTKKMMSVIVECRKLTWASLPATIKIKSIPGEQPFVAAASDQSQSRPVSLDDPPMAVLSATARPVQQAHDIIGNLLSSWLHYGSSTEEPVTASDDILSIPIANDEIKPAESNRQRNLAQQQNRQRQASFLNMGISMVNGIIPNTLWCGLGDRAANYSELGSEYKVDACCRAHDHCPVRLKPFTTDYGLVNWSMSTRSHCNCDLDFNDCLMAVNTTLSNVIKVLYFRFVGLQCIDAENHSGSEAATDVETREPTVNG